MNYTQEELDYWCYHVITKADLISVESTDLFEYHFVEVLIESKHNSYQGIRIHNKTEAPYWTFSRFNQSSTGIPDFPLDLYGMKLPINDNVRMMLDMHRL